MSNCEHRHTHPGQCDDCGAPWCDVCATYHDNPSPYSCGRALREEDGRLRALNIELTADFHRVQHELDCAEQDRDHHRETLRLWWKSQWFRSCGCTPRARELLHEREPWLFEKDVR